MDFNAEYMESFLQKIPDTDTRIKLCWTVARLFRVAKTHKEIIRNLLGDSCVVDAELLVKILESSWKWDYNFGTHEFSPANNITELQNTKEQTLVSYNTRVGFAGMSALLGRNKDTDTGSCINLTSSEDTPVGGSDVSLSDVSSDAESSSLTNKRRKSRKPRQVYLHHKSDKKKIIMCHLCARPFCGKSAKSSLLRHLREYHRNKCIKCDICVKKFVNPRSYEHHKKTAHDPDYHLQCRKEWCSQTFKFYRTRNQHEATCISNKNQNKSRHKNNQ